MSYISVSFTSLINKTYIIQEQRDEGMKIRSKQTYSQKYHTYVQTCIDTYMNVTSPTTTTRHALISSYFYYLLQNMHYIPVSFTLLINKTRIIEERRKKRNNEGRKEQRNEETNKRTKETHIQHNSIKLKSWWISLLSFENNLFNNEEFVFNSM